MDAIWGFHVHQEVPEAQFARALAIQEACRQYLAASGVRIDADDAIRPGYGPHLAWMWELRVESGARGETLLRQLGLAIAFLAVNRFHLSAYIHPLRHDPRRDEDLATEGRLNQGNTLWFGFRVPQRQEFFFEPERDAEQRVVDTRTSRVLTRAEKEERRRQGERQLGFDVFRDPAIAVRNGFHIHVDYVPEEEVTAMAVFDRFVTYLLGRGLRPTSTRLYRPGENGPHLRAGWEVKFERPGCESLETIGIAVAWLMCNRQGLSVSLHPVTWAPGDRDEELRAHEDYWMFIGEIPPLDLGFFRREPLPAENRP